MRNIRTEVGGMALILLGVAGSYHAQTPSQNAAERASQSSAPGHIKGTATYRERMALPPNAAFEATLVDVSRADAPAEVIGRIQLVPTGNPPIAFDIPYDPPRINEKGAYAVLARITTGDQLMFTTTQSYPVLTRNNGNDVTLLLKSAGGAAPARAGEEPTLQGLPASFVGTMPCADCPGIHYQLDLKPDHTFSSHMKYQERDATFNDSGRWELANNGKMLVLQGKSKVNEKFSVLDADTLRKLDINGNEIVSQLNYDLKRAPQSAPGERPAAADAPLENTHWKLAALGDASVSADSVQSEAFLVLDPQQHRISGSGGCNRLTGSYELDGEQLKFGQTAGTMMMCPKGMDTEQDFFKSLGQVNQWKITGQRLELLDSDRKVLARFAAGQE
jgi:uncharacterized lipoprotein YbaY/heat shock protein HslJ